MEFNFAQNTTVDSLDKVPTDFRGLYVADGDKFKLDTDDPKVASSVKAITGLNTALQSERGLNKDLKSKVVDLTPLSVYGENVADIVEGVATAVTDAGKNAKGKGADDVKAAVKSATDALASKHAVELLASTEQNTKLTGQLHNVLVTGDAKAALSDAKAISADVLLPHLVGQVRVDEVNGELAVSIIGADKQARYGSGGSLMTIDELVEEMKGSDQYKPFFASEGRQGGGGPPTQNGPGPKTPGVEPTSLENIGQGMADRGLTK